MARELTPDQTTALGAAIGRTGVLEVLIDTTQDDALAYANQLSEAFTGNGWTVIASPLPNPWFATPSGLSFMAQGDLPLSELQIMVISGLNSADVEYSQLDSMLAEGTDVKLLVGRVGV